MADLSRRLFFDNAATSSPKPPQVSQAMVDYATRLGGSPGRGAYFEAQETGRLIDRCRARISRLLNAEGDPEQIIFTLNCTDALNLAIKGVLFEALLSRRPVHVVTSAFDHNSVLRPLNALAVAYRDLVSITHVRADRITGRVDPAEFERILRERETTLVVLNHASNVTGVVQDAGAVGAICRERGVPFLLDAAQSLGHIPVDVRALNVDLLAFPGHKGLLGPSGTGGLYLRPGMESRVRTLREGGTGSRSEDDTQPRELPDRYEPGSPNAIGILGLSEGVQFLLNYEYAGARGPQAIAAHERDLMQTFLDELGFTGMTPKSLAVRSERDSAITLFGPPHVDGRVGVFSVAVEGLMPQLLAAALESQFGILTRAGIHCAPLAHRSLGTTAHNGTTRLSFGPFLTQEDVRYAASALMEIATELWAAAGRRV